MSTAGQDRASASIRWRALSVLGVFALGAGLLGLESVHDWVLRALGGAAPLISSHPTLGPVLFVALAALSAVLAFFSSAIIVPAAVYVWGRATTIGLLWLGWWLGGALTYSMGRGLRAPLVHAFARMPALERYLPHLPRELGWSTVLLLQLALPSEVPGYICGALRVRFRIYATALAVAELPYAVGAVMVGDGVVQGRAGWLLALGALAALSMVCAYRVLRTKLKRDPVPES